MLFRPLLASLLCLVTQAATSSDTTNATHPPLFPPPSSSSSSSLPTLHTSLSTLLPILPHLSPPPEHTLLVTLATSAFKPLLYNWLCFLRYRAKWGAPPTHNEHGEPVTEQLRYGDTPKVLVVTSDEALARELSDEGVVTWWLKGVDWEQVESVELGEEDGADGREDAVKEVEQMLQDDLFTNLRLLDLLLPPEPASKDDAERLTSRLLPWGTLHYQSLMLERTAVMSALVGALAESQSVDVEYRKAQDRYWRERILAHDWENDEPFELPKFAGVKGVLLVDNDAIWLSSPSAFLSHYYRPSGPHPSIIYAPDMAPTTRNAWGTCTMPCACFFYTRTSDVGAQLASHPPSSATVDPYAYSPAAGAAQAWRKTALCHISMLLSSLATGRRQAFASESSIAELDKARAPSFQATALGPALFLAEQVLPSLPEVSHEQWMDALGSGNVDDLVEILEESGLAGLPDDEGGDAGEGKTCLELAQAFQTFSPNPSFLLDSGITSLSSAYSLSRPSRRSTRPHTPIQTAALPYDLFPPGMRYFDGGLEPGTQPCVVHANYATGGRKQELLRERGLWALVEPQKNGGDVWRCDADVLARA
ncbi:hypothetical protein JCM1841_001379 [Sporobolomyces salmonicolor]